MRRHEALNRRVAHGNIDLLMIGDSITQQWGSGGGGIWREFYGDRNAVNLGISGDGTQHVLWRLENGNINDISPKLAVIMIGTNNSNFCSAQEIADGITAIVEKLRTELPEMKILLLGIFPRGANNRDGKRRVNARVNEIVSALDDGESIFYLDIGESFLADDGTLSLEMMYDRLHLTPAAYRIWAESIEEKVAQLMGE